MASPVKVRKNVLGSLWLRLEKELSKNIYYTPIINESENSSTQ